MTVDIKMPAPTPGMTEGTLVRWLKQEGDWIDIGEAIAEVETDKAMLEIESFDAGTLGKILVPAGTSNVAVDTIIAMLIEEGAATLPSEDEAPTVDEAPAHEHSMLAAKTMSVANPTSVASTMPGPQLETPPREQGRVFASPLARRLGREHGIDVADIQGSGPHGRVVRIDVERAISEPAPADQRDSKAHMDSRIQTIPHTAMRRTIASRLSESKREVPHFYLTVDCDVGELLTLRSRLNAKGAEASPAFKLSANDILIYAVARSLRRVPEVNASWTNEATIRYQEVDVAVAVATEGGLVTPVLRQADRMGLAEITTTLRELAESARAGRLAPSEYQGGGFTISNLGMYGIRDFAAIINPPQAAILAVGAIEKRPIVRDNELAVGEMMTLTLSADHRVIDGAVGACFLAVLRELIEDPLNLLV
ncbi:pyruvate dehydrogenase complex dihydrolipoamide acetyltransferase [Vreelandella nanhaiensis]|uniref:Acetyltransferase component of pyruvate dehydrogenase complex n=1 Tax=Vreelandella nanhaiensis TaxID=1258546 RepID=A0A433KSL9_9GAMM|nr:pyruvate dehydrogenase complex dihydrolipoamide acetyltransferase [Halomonas nanhaiensis]RUR32670.1 pyruvate dehydrogenase complex dihydrolipoamide acetyltransferase [Halomonas nanhaiensis]